MTQELRHAFRRLMRSPGFTVPAVLTLALGLAAYTAMVNVGSGVLVQPLPFLHPEQLVQISEVQPRTDTQMGFDNSVVYRDFAEWLSSTTQLDGMVTYLRGRRNLQRRGDLTPVIVVDGERGLLPLLGVNAFIGRTFAADDAGNVAVASYGFWKRQLGGDPAAIGSVLTIDGQPCTVIGVMPERFEFPYRTTVSPLEDVAPVDLWVPWDIPADLRAHPDRRLQSVVARLRPGISVEAARRELIAMRAVSEGGRQVRVTPLKDVIVGNAREPILVLLGAVVLVLLIACVNVANLFLARTTSRAAEIAVRAALGATRGRLIRELLIESLVVTLAAAGIGVALGVWSSRMLLNLTSAEIPRAQEVAFNWRVLAGVFSACVVCSVAIGLAPALNAVRGQIQAIKRRGTGAAVRQGLVLVQVALAFVLLVGAGILLSTFINLQRTEPGLVVRNLLTAHVVVSDGPEAMAIEQRLSQLPGVRAAGVISLLPLQQSRWNAGFTIAGNPLVHEAELRFVTPGYFSAAGIPFVRGRGFNAGDRVGSHGVTIVNDALARRYFPKEDPVGKETNRGTIIAVVGSVRQDALRDPARPEMYFAVAQNFAQLRSQGLTLLVRAEADPAQLASEVRAAVREIDPDQAVFRISTMQGVVDESLAETRLQAWLLALLAGIGLLLAITGIYGVISYLVALRTREFAIRMALGADTWTVLRLVLRHGLLLAAFGTGIGCVLTLALTRVLRGTLYGVEPSDPLTFAGVAVLLAAAALVAHFAPAKRAAAVEPATVLRYE